MSATQEHCKTKTAECGACDLIGLYSKSIRKQQPGGAVISDNVSLACMTMINPATGWFEIIKVPILDLDEFTAGNDEYIYKPSNRGIQLFNNTWLSRYPLSRKIMFDSGYGFKQDVTPLMKALYIKTVLTTIKNLQDNDPVEWVHKLLLDMIVTKDLANKVSEYIDTWGETLASISRAIRASYQRTIQNTPGQSLFGRYIIFNLMAVVDCRYITTRKQQ